MHCRTACGRSHTSNMWFYFFLGVIPAEVSWSQVKLKGGLCRLPHDQLLSSDLNRNRTIILSRWTKLNMFVGTEGNTDMLSRGQSFMWYYLKCLKYEITACWKLFRTITNTRLRCFHISHILKKILIILFLGSFLISLLRVNNSVAAQ